MKQMSHSLFQQIMQIKQGLQEEHHLAFKAESGFTSVTTRKAAQLGADYTFDFPVIRNRILEFLKEHHSFDAGLMQRWVEQHAQYLDENDQPKSLLHGRGHVKSGSAAQFRALAHAIEQQRQEFNTTLARHFKQIPEQLKTASSEQIEQIYSFLEHHRHHYIKEILDLCDALESSPVPLVKAFAERVYDLVRRREREMLNALFIGEALEIKILAGKHNKSCFSDGE